jgi:hypothetical protein
MGLISGGGKSYVPTQYLRPISFEGKKNGQTVTYGGLGRKIDYAVYESLLQANPQSVIKQKRKDGKFVYLTKYNALSGVFAGFKLGKMEVNGGEITTIAALFEEPTEKCFYVVDLGPADKSRALAFYKAVLHQDFDVSKPVVVYFSADTFVGDKGEAKVALRPMLYQEGPLNSDGQPTKRWLNTAYKTKDGEIKNANLAEMPLPLEEQDDFAAGKKEKDFKPQIKWLKMRMKDNFSFVLNDELGAWLIKNYPQYVTKNTPVSAAALKTAVAATSPATDDEDEDDEDPFGEVVNQARSTSDTTLEEQLDGELPF